ASCADAVQIDLVEPRLDRRQALLEGPAARIENIVEGVEAADPLIESADQQTEVAIVLQRLLKGMRRQQLVQIAALRRIGNGVELPVPSACGVLVRTDERFEQRAVAHRFDRALDAADLLVERV